MRSINHKQIQLDKRKKKKQKDEKQNNRQLWLTGINRRNKMKSFIERNSTTTDIASDYFNKLLR